MGTAKQSEVVTASETAQTLDMAALRTEWSPLTCGDAQVRIARTGIGLRDCLSTVGLNTSAE
jgi:hypothetical protein